MKKILSIFVLLISIFFISSCSCTYKNVIKNISKTIEDVSEITSVTTISDNSVVVSKYEKVLTVTGDDTAEVSTVTYKLTNVFELDKDSTTHTSEKINKDELFGIDLTSSYIKESSHDGSIYTYIVTKDNMNNVIGNSFEITGDVKIVLTMDGKKAINVLITYTLASGRFVTTNIDYEY